MKETQKASLITILKTSERANLLQEILLDIIDDAYKTKVSLLTKLEKTVPVDLQTNLFTFFKKEKIDITSNDRLITEIRTITNELSALPSVSITIAIQPNFAVETFLFDTISRLCSTPLLLDIHYNPDIIGGAIVQRNGVYKDYSLEKILTTL